MAEGVDQRALQSIVAELARAVGSLSHGVSVRAVAGSHVSAAEPVVAAQEEDLLAAVQEILSLPASASSPGELFRVAADRLARILDVDRVMFFVAEGDRLAPRSARGFRRDDLESIAIAAGDGLVGRAYRENRLLRHELDPEIAGDWFTDRFPVKSAIAVPVRGDGDVAGVLYAGRRVRRPFGSTDALVLLVAAERIGAALRDQSRADRRTAEISRLRELTRFAGDLPVGRCVDEILAQACELGCRMLGVRAAAVAIGVEELEVVAAQGLPSSPSTPLSVREGLTAEVYDRDGPVSCPDLRARTASDHGFVAEPIWRGCLAVPLRVRGLPVGVMYLLDTEVREFSPDEIEHAGMLAGITAAAVENSRAHAKLTAAFAATRSGQERATAAERARALREIASGLTRELNQVFAIVLGKSQLLRARTQEDAMREGIAAVEEAAWRGADVMHRLGALAVLDAHAADDAADLKALVQELVAVAGPIADRESQSRAPIELVFDLPAVPPVRGSHSALREAIDAILRNAADAMPAGGCLTVRLRARDAGVELVVEDTGGGLDDDVRRRALEPFFTTRAPAHLGLGLTIAHVIATSYGGSLELAARPAGATVRMWLPLAGDAPEPLAPAPARGGDRLEDRDRVHASGSRTEASILLFEDDDAVRTMLVEALAKAGHQVHVAVGVDAGLARVEREAFDVVLADLALPDRSGLIVARAVKRARPATAVILITSWSPLLDPERLRDHGVDLTLVKPFRPERAVSVVSEALRLASSS